MAEIITFEEYVGKYCKGTSFKRAQEYAQEGKRLLEAINNGQINLAENRAEKMACLIWYLTEQSFKNQEPFGKGVFAVSMKDPQTTEALYEFFRNGRLSVYSQETVTNSSQRTKESILKTTEGIFSAIKGKEKDNNPTYSRTSSHFNELIKKKEEGHFGIDAKRSKIPLPMHFKTTAFALCQRKDTNGNQEGETFLYIKPETEGADASDVKSSILHGINFLKPTEKNKDGLARYDEKMNQELRLKFTEGQIEVDRSNLNDHIRPGKRVLTDEEAIKEIISLQKAEQKKEKSEKKKEEKAAQKEQLLEKKQDVRARPVAMRFQQQNDKNVINPLQPADREPLAKKQSKIKPKT